LLVSICTGARAIGVELEPSFVASAERCAQKLNLKGVTFVQQDARDADLSGGTVFYFYTPFTGSILRTVLNSLRNEAAKRPIRVCTFGPCTRTVAQEPWLEPGMILETDQVIVFIARR
jgi:H2-forming N5,N10-methylenetetrahydromethanopterin dehydrogenase-like enzyme